jgi:hypothetical protein
LFLSLIFLDFMYHWHCKDHMKTFKIYFWTKASLFLSCIILGMLEKGLTR